MARTQTEEGPNMTTAHLTRLHLSELSSAEMTMAIDLRYET
jgi:hypothetical protein